MSQTLISRERVRLTKSAAKSLIAILFDPVQTNL